MDPSVHVVQWVEVNTSPLTRQRQAHRNDPALNVIQRSEMMVVDEGEFNCSKEWHPRQFLTRQKQVGRKAHQCTLYSG